MVNYVHLEMKRRETGEVVYRNGWITDKPVTEENVEHLASHGRTRWKAGNGHNNVLKNRGYNLRHNFGHGKKYASEIFFILNLTGSRLHTIPEPGDGDFREARKYAGRRDMLSPGCMPPCVMPCMKPGGISRSLSPPKKTWNENKNCWGSIIFS
jgi:hypothetical protein